MIVNAQSSGFVAEAICHNFAFFDIRIAVMSLAFALQVNSSIFTSLLHRRHFILTQAPSTPSVVVEPLPVVVEATSST